MTLEKWRTPRRAPRGRAADKAAKPLWQRIIEIGDSIPDDELKNFPTDGARNLDHYLYGAPKNEEQLRAVFADAAYYIALLLRRDNLREAAVEFSSTASDDTHFVTTDLVFIEVLAYVAARGRNAREAAVALIDELRSDASVTIVSHTPDLFGAALDLYRGRPDKQYSLVDCMSMLVCRRRNITRVLTNDQHFEQEGFTIVL